jgi:hypothetical protein
MALCSNVVFSSTSPLPLPWHHSLPVAFICLTPCDKPSFVILRGQRPSHYLSLLSVSSLLCCHSISLPFPHVSFSELCCDWVRLGSVWVKREFPTCFAADVCTVHGWAWPLRMVLWWLETIATLTRSYHFCSELRSSGIPTGILCVLLIHRLISNTNIACIVQCKARFPNWWHAGQILPASNIIRPHKWILNISYATYIMQ